MFCNNVLQQYFAITIITCYVLHGEIARNKKSEGLLLFVFFTKGPFKCYVTQMGVGGVDFSGKKRYEGVRFNVISVTRYVGGGPISRSKALRNT